MKSMEPTLKRNSPEPSSLNPGGDARLVPRQSASAKANRRQSWVAWLTFAATAFSVLVIVITGAESGPTGLPFGTNPARGDLHIVIRRTDRQPAVNYRIKALGEELLILDRWGECVAPARYRGKWAEIYDEHDVRVRSVELPRSGDLSVDLVSSSVGDERPAPSCSNNEE